MKIIRLSFVLFFFSIIHAYSKDVYLTCESTTKFKTSFIINDEKKILILDGIEREVVNWTKEFITFWKSQTMKEISEPRISNQILLIEFQDLMVVTHVRLYKKLYSKKNFTY